MECNASGISNTLLDSVDVAGVSADGTMFCHDSDVNELHGFERRGSHFAAVDLAVDLRAIKLVQVDSMLNDSAGMYSSAKTSRAFGINEVMICHGMFLLVMYIMDGILRGISKFYIEKTYVDIAFRYFQLVWIFSGAFLSLDGRL